jgi:hypothetical protein
MKKIAIFVEGQTEALFVEWFIDKLFSHVHLEKHRYHGGKRFPRSNFMTSRSSPPDPEFYVLIFDCGTDGRVISDINSNYDSLVESGHELIIGLRDVYPEFTYQQRGKLLEKMTKTVKKAAIKPQIILATMEIEAWFLAEHTHFMKLDSILTSEMASEIAQCNLLYDNLELLEHPSKVLKNIYESVGLEWEKVKPI